MPEKCGQSHAKCRSWKSPLINALKSHLQQYQQHRQQQHQQQLGSKLLNLLRPHATNTDTHSKHTHSKHTWRMRNLRNCNRNSINSTRLTRLLQPPSLPPLMLLQLLLITKENVKCCTWCSSLPLSLSHCSPFPLFVQQIRFDKLLQNLQKKKTRRKLSSKNAAN